MSARFCSVLMVILLGALSNALEAHADEPDQTWSNLRNHFAPAFVRVQVEDAFGSGTVVANDPPIVATCLHVIRGHSAATVVNVDDNIPINVTAIAFRPGQDLVFLKLDADHWDAVVPWHQNAIAVTTGQEVGVFGYPNYCGEMRHMGFGMVGRRLNSLGQTGSPLGLVTDEVVDTVNGPLNPGVSGGPIFLADGGIVALAAGEVTHAVQESDWFSIPVSGALPQDGDWKPLASIDWSSQPDPYAGTGGVHVKSIQTKEGVAVIGSSVACQSIAGRCASLITSAYSLASGSGGPLPATLLGGSTSCQSFYTSHLAALSNQLDDWKTSRAAGIALYAAPALRDSITGDLTATLDATPVRKGASTRFCTAVSMPSFSKKSFDICGATSSEALAELRAKLGDPKAKADIQSVLLSDPEVFKAFSLSPDDLRLAKALATVVPSGDLKGELNKAAKQRDAPSASAAMVKQLLNPHTDLTAALQSVKDSHSMAANHSRASLTHDLKVAF